MQYTIVGTEDGSNITVFVPGQAPLVAHSSHPNYDKIVAGVLANDENVAELFDVSVAVAEKFDRLTERVSVANGRLYFDAVEVDNSLANQVVRFLNEGVEDYKPLVKFFDNVQQNDNEHSREQLYDWLNTRDFTISPDGMIVGYKGVTPLEDNVFESISSGRAIVNGEVQNGRIKQKVGDVVEMPRNEVQFDPAVGCSTGLHVGTWDYASDFGRGAVLTVNVNPRDVVSVPTECENQKMRVCRYTVAATTDVPYSAPVWDDFEDEWDDEDEDDYYRDFWGEDEDFEDDEPEFRPQSLLHPNFGEDEPEVTKAFGEQPFAVEGSAVQETEDGQAVISVGDKFADRDARRSGNVFTVESVDEDSGIATGKWSPSGLTRSIAFDRLLSRKYDRA
jgi:hypothetical protein